MTERWPAGARRLGLDAIRVDLPPDPDRGAILDALRATPGVRDAVVAESTAAVWFDPDSGPPPLAEALRASARAGPSREHLLPTRYDGPDLATVAAWARLPPAEVARRHAERVYTVLFLGFAPGFAYLGDVDPLLAAPRLASPRPVVAAGAVAVAGMRTAVYPGGTGGGWNLLGHTGVSVVLDGRPRFAVGDRIRFVPA